MSEALNVNEAIASVDAFLKETVDNRIAGGVEITASPHQPQQGYSWEITVTAQPGTALHDYLKSEQSPVTN
jgi:hypothetical protein